MLALPQQIEAKQLYALIPHQGPMMLLDRVEAWDGAKIVCSATSHLDEHNPLKVNGRLSYIHVIEYGAQAAAIHLAINAVDTKTPMVGHKKLAPVATAYLAVTRNFSFEEGYLDAHPDTRLMLTSEVVLVGPRIYQYRVNGTINGKTVAEGTISLVTDDIED
ncbi:hypothetical protein [Dyella tabacisoli]|uniref:Phosphotransferase n=1 Tax=Dyella tabacisoli TaxID=2282381 RepID=A0A369UKL4_9GAMM|nr:hypothetical protein [Dyella tabacisoli]RDD81312.1 hypothetical protein DVJ77_13470 [Dyella tabacisoli]